MFLFSFVFFFFFFETPHALTDGFFDRESGNTTLKISVTDPEMHRKDETAKKNKKKLNK